MTGDHEKIILREMRDAINRVIASKPPESDLKRTLGLCLGCCADEYGQRFGYEETKRMLIHAQRYADEKTIRGQLVYALDHLMQDE
jgi:hypothetical protein